MNKLTTAKRLDLILEYCNKKETKFLFSNEIQRDVLPELSKSEITLLLKKISSEPKPVARVVFTEFAEHIEENELTDKFLQQGGYANIESKEKERIKRKIYRDSMEFDNAEVDLDLARKILQDYSKTKWYSRLGFFIAIGLVMFELIRFVIE